MRTFKLYYPEHGTYGIVTVEVDEGQTAEDAIILNGDAVYEWRLVEELTAA